MRSFFIPVSTSPARLLRLPCIVYCVISVEFLSLSWVEFKVLKLFLLLPPVFHITANITVFFLILCKFNLSSLYHSHLPNEEQHCINCIKVFPMISQPSHRALPSVSPLGTPEYSINSSHPTEQLCFTRWSCSEIIT